MDATGSANPRLILFPTWTPTAFSVAELVRLGIIEDDLKYKSQLSQVSVIKARRHGSLFSGLPAFTHVVSISRF